MSRFKAEHSLPRAAFDGLAEMQDRRALIAVDLGAESCRVSLLRWTEAGAIIQLVHRFPNAPVLIHGHLYWSLDAIVGGVEEGLRKCIASAPEGIRSIAVDGWAVDYVRISENGEAIADPFCYRDVRTVDAEASLHGRIARARLRALSGIQLQPLNTVYQQHADNLAGANVKWLNLPEYLLFRWGGKPVAETTNATHTGMVGLDGKWCAEIFEAAGVRMEDAPTLVAAGTDFGEYNGGIAGLRGARLIAPCCHDTASAVAGIPAEGDHWAYISSGTWSLVGTVLDRPCNTEEASRENFTNLGAAGGQYLFHKGLSGMWLLQQSMQQWKLTDVPAMVAQAREVPAFAVEELIDVDDPALTQVGDMPARINAQRSAKDLPSVLQPAQMARLIFDSLAARYAQVLKSISTMTGKKFDRIYVVGGASQNELLNELTAQATGLPVIRGAVESATIGNFAVQLATFEKDNSAGNVAKWATRLQ